jgi:hypothetical protein
MDGIIYWSIFAWSVLVTMHTLTAYLRSGAWVATRDRFIHEEMLEGSDKFHISTEEMVEMQSVSKKVLK